MRFFAAALLALLPLTAAAQSAVLEITAAPDSHTWITASISGHLCGRYSLLPLRDGMTINIVAVGRGGGVCLPEGPFPTLTVPIGILPAGEYRVMVSGDLTAETRDVIVRSADPVIATPGGAGMNGGTRVLLHYAEGDHPPGNVVDVKFGGTDARIILDSAFDTLVEAPPHAPGLVNVVVTTRDSTLAERALHAENSFAYFDDRIGRPDGDLFEAVVFPISAESNGALGTRWQSSNRTAQELFWRSPCDACDLSRPLPNTNDPAGQTLWIPRGTAGRFTSTLMEKTTRTLTQIPVAREGDFNRPLPPFVAQENARTMLRVWALDDVAEPQPFTVFGSAGHSKVFNLTFARTTPASLPFASVDLTPLLATFERGEEVTLGRLARSEPPALWPMVSITDNGTQRVTIIAPR